MNTDSTGILMSFMSDYLEGAHPRILERLTETNLEKTPGYGTDHYCRSAAEKIRAACRCPGAEITFLSGGTQTNTIVISALLRSYEGVVAATSGHISIHEAGAIEHCGHKVLALEHQLGKLQPETIDRCFLAYSQDANRDHTVMPGMVYISHPTEYGTLYTKEELTKISHICRKHQALLYLDGARLGYGLAAADTDVTLEVIANTCDAFYIGGTKVGALFGEALVLTRPDLIPHFVSIIKQNGALLAKGRLLGLQFDTLFTDGLYLSISKHAIALATQLKALLIEKGYRLLFDSPTNQQFVIMENRQLAQLAEKLAFSYWERYDEAHSVIRLATSWATTQADLDALALLL